MKKYLVFFFIALYLLNQISVKAQSVKEIKSFRFLEYKDGLPEIDIKETIVDNQNGYWFRTTKNLVYYNGHEFISYNADNLIFNLCNRHINDISIHNNKIYVFGDEGVDEIDCESKQSNPLYIGENTSKIMGGILTRSGKLIVGSQNGSISKIENNQLKPLAKIDFYSGLEFHETESGHLLVSNANRTIIVFSKYLKKLRTIQFDPSRVLSGGIHEYPGLGTIVVAYRDAYLYLPHSASLKLISFPVSFRRLYYHNDKNDYVVSKFNVINQIAVKTKKNTLIKLKLDNNYFVNHFTVDKNKTIILSTNQGLILFKEPVGFVSYIDDEINKSDLKSTTRRAILETEDGKILQLNYKQINLYDPQSDKNTVIAENNIDSYSGLIQGENVWIGIDGAGLAKFNLITLKIKPTVSYANYLKGHTSNVTSVVKYSDSKLMIGEVSNAISSLQLYDIHSDVFSPFVIKGLKNKYLNKRVSAILSTGKNEKWICSDEGLFLINANDSLIFYLDKKDIGTDSVNYVYQDKDDLWIATHIGLVKFDLLSKRKINHFNVNNGLAGNRCLAIIPDQFSTFWIPTYTGLARFNKLSNQIINYNVTDGFLDEEYNYSSYLKSKTGDLYFGGLNGYVKITPEPFEQNNTPKADLKLDYILKQRNANLRLATFLGNENIRIHKTNERLEISFSVRKPVSSEFARYYYRIVGLQNEWIALNRQNKLHLAFLPPGKYTVEIKANFLNNNFEESIFKLPLEIYVYWFETKAFYFFLAAFIVLLITYFIYYRYQNKLEQSKIKADLARDIHDEIGTQLTKSILRIEILRYKEFQLADDFKKIEFGLREVIQSFRNMLWSINSDNTKTEDFVNRVKSMLDDIFEGTSFEVIVTNLASDIFFKTNIQIKRNLLLIIKEAANNALKHSNGNLFEFVIHKDGQSWNFLMADNGVNDVAYQIVNDEIKLKSIENRVKSINGILTVQKESNGFFIKINL